MDRPDSRRSFNGGVRLNGYGYSMPSPYLASPYPQTPSPYGPPSGFGGFPSRRVEDPSRFQSHPQPSPFQPQSLHSPFQQHAQYRVDAQPDARESVHPSERAITLTPTPAHLADFICTGATDTVEGLAAQAHRQRRSTNSDQRDFAPTHYEPPRRSTRSATIVTQERVSHPYSSTRKDPNIDGNSIAFINVDIQDPSFCKHINSGFMPTVEQVFEHLPFIEPCRVAAPSNAGVLRIKNIPYATPRSEITAFIPRNVQVLSQPPGSPYFAVHIIMERHTGKTMDAFVEFNMPSEATYVLNQCTRRKSQGRHPKIGDREVEVEISNQEDLLGELFPRAKDVFWRDGTPQVVECDEKFFPNMPAAGFAGFLQNEEVVHMVKHAEQPNRSPFAQRCFIRTYEAMISTIHKYPWFAHGYVNMDERRLLFEAAFASLRALLNFLRRTREDRIFDQTKPTPTTLQELIVAILTCPGFSEKQKNGLIIHLHQNSFGSMASGKGVNMKFGGNSAIASHWPFHVLARNPKHSDRYVEWVAHLLKQATMIKSRSDGKAVAPSLTEMFQQRSSGNNLSPFGDINIEYSRAKTMEEVGTIELKYVEKLLRATLDSSNRTPGPPRTPRPDTATSFRTS